MKKTILNILLAVIVFICLSVTASADVKYTGTGTFNICTGELTSGYYVFGVGTDDSSISALNTTSSGNWIKFTDISSTSGSITNPDTSIVWYHDVTSGTFNNGTNYVAWPTTGNSAGLETTGTPLTVTETETSGVYNITVTATPGRVLRLNRTSGYRFYTSSTGTDTFYFFKLENEQSSNTQIATHSVTSKKSNTGTGYEYNYAFEMKSPEDIKGTFIIALYDGQNRLACVITVPMNTADKEFEQSQTTITTETPATTYKIMFWCDLENLMPLCEVGCGSIIAQ